MKKFERLRHIRYFSNSLSTHLPPPYSAGDTNRLTLVHFAVQALDLLGALDDGSCYVDKAAIAEWIYGLQTLPTTDEEDGGSVEAGGSNDGDADECGHRHHDRHAGFKGSPYLGPTSTEGVRHPYDHSHIAMTYVALCALASLGDDLSRVQREPILSALSRLQKKKRRPPPSANSSPTNDTTDANDANDASTYDNDDLGSFVATSDGGAENDLRFLFCAASVCVMLGDTQFTSMDVPAAVGYIKRCRSYDGAFGLGPGREGHGGSTLCGVATLRILGKLDEVLDEEGLGWREDLVRWCVSRQKGCRAPRRGDDDGSDAGDADGYEGGNVYGGMQGRPNKLQDTCYSHWIGGTLRILGMDHLLDGRALRRYVLECQTPYGGFSKVWGVNPDLFHSFYSLAWLSMSERSCGEDIGDEGGGDDGSGGGGDGDEEREHREAAEALSTLAEYNGALGMRASRVAVFRHAFPIKGGEDAE